MVQAASGARLRKQLVVRQHEVGRAAEVAVCQVLERPEAVVGPAHPAAQHRHVRLFVDAVPPDGRAHLHAARAVPLALPQPRCQAAQACQSGCLSSRGCEAVFCAAHALPRPSLLALVVHELVQNASTHHL